MAFDLRSRLASEETDQSVLRAPLQLVPSSALPQSVRSLALKPAILSLVYVIYPLVGLFVLIDALFLEGHFKSNLPSSADDLKLFLVFFGSPHVLAGIFSDIDKEYVRAYRFPMLVYFLIFIPFLSLLDQIDFHHVVTSYAVWTTYHHISQATGICRMLLGPVSQFYFTGWKWSLIVAFFICIPFTEFSVFQLGVESLSGLALGIAFAVNLFCLWKLEVLKKTKHAKIQVGLTVASLAFLPFLIVNGYGFFVPVCTRVVHDISALAFYSVHDQNRAFDKPGANRFYALFSWTKIPVSVLCPILGVLVALFCFPLMESDAGLRVLYGIGFFHYFMEGWIWKRGSMHRRYVVFA